MKIAFIGGVKFSHEILSTMLDNGWNISLVFSYDDTKKKYYSDIKNFAELTTKYDVKHIQVNNINDDENIKIFQEIKPDLILVMGWSQLLNNEIIKIPKLGVIGSHPTELPKFRGRAPIPWSIIKKLKESALTFFYIDEGIDDGDILDQRKFNILDEDDATSIYQKMIDLGKKMILDNLLILKNNEVTRKKQNQSKFIENWPKRTMEDGKINWNDPSEEIHRLIRATTSPYPGAFTKFKNEKLIIWKSNFLDDLNNNPGVISEIENNYVLIGTGKGTLKIFKASYMNKCRLNEIFSPSDVGLKLE
jgi:methionyl-tRNA formyltransferase